MSNVKTETPASASKRPEPPPRPMLARPEFSRTQELVTLVASAGTEDETKFIIHKEFPCHYSSVLRAAFTSAFTEGQTQCYKFEDVGNCTIKLLVQWLYYQDLQLFQLETKKVDREESTALVQLWVLADKLLMPKLQNAVAKKLWKVMRVCNNLLGHTFRYVYDNTVSGSPLRLLFLHQFIAYCGDNAVEAFKDLAPIDMLLDLIRLQRTICQMDLPKKLFLKSDNDQGRYDVPVDTQN